MLISIIVGFLVLEFGMRAYSGVPIFSATNFVARSLDIVRADTGVMDLTNFSADGSRMVLAPRAPDIAPRASESETMVQNGCHSPQKPYSLWATLSQLVRACEMQRPGPLS